MRALLLTAVILFSFSVLSAQDNEPAIRPAVADTIAPPVENPIAAPMPVEDSLRIRENVARGLESFLRTQDEQNRKRKKEAMIRIGIGVAMMAILVIGLLRKRKK